MLYLGSSLFSKDPFKVLQLYRLGLPIYFGCLRAIARALDLKSEWDQTIELFGCLCAIARALDLESEWDQTMELTVCMCAIAHASDLKSGSGQTMELIGCLGYDKPLGNVPVVQTEVSVVVS